ncbi:hypothetical protein CMV30_00040 [Nibricoccus aquaticus]|uniref:Uncharacterized protein n=1 Tax=Nibricoccus aquaticus TaxID=2576891 RepID=A0A290QF53_9BACT|nr:hypothetical protein [Nibricoccus aquaticus]ATC62492.1 hypothetical protein CMV30_00040 [Nibricoccus aquaticus]
MKKISALLLAAIVLAVTGCESGSRFQTAFRERISPTFRPHVVKAEQKPAYEAARVAMKKMNFTFTSGGAAQGKMEAISALQTGEGPRAARQVSLSVKLAPAANGGTEVSAMFFEILENEFSKRDGSGTSTPMPDSPLYEVFFRHLDAALAQPAE